MSGSVTRRALALLVAGAGAAASVAHALVSGDAFSLAAIVRDLAAYDGFGEKRSGGDGDRAACAYAEARLRSLGFTTERHDFTSPYLDHDESALEIAGTRFEALAQAPTGITTPDGVVAPVFVVTPGARPPTSASGGVAHIVLGYARHSRMDERLEQQIAALAAAGAAAVVIATPGPSREAAVLNVRADLDFGDLPIAVVGAATSRALRSAAEAGAPVRLIVRARKGVRSAQNLIATRAGGARTLMVTTPLTGWTHCTAERGPGYAIFLALADYVSQARTDLTVRFVATSGHEYENLGAQRYMSEGAPSPDAVALWLHLGAGLAARDHHEPPLTPLRNACSQRYLIAAPPFFSAAERAFSGLSGLECVYPASAEAAGETGEILRKGYANVVGAFGAHQFHHTKPDRLDKTGPELVRPVALAFRDLLRRTIFT